MTLPVAVAMACSLVLWIMNVVALLKSMDPNNHPAEDAKVGMTDKDREAFKEKLLKEGGFSRWGRIAVNQQESFPLALVIMWAALLSCGNVIAIAQLMIGTFIGYTVLRIGFVICYLYALSPWRSICFLAGNACVLISACGGIYGAMH